MLMLSSIRSAVRFNGRNCNWKSITSAIGPPSWRAGDAEIEVTGGALGRLFGDFGDGANLTADLPARRGSRVHVRVRSTCLDGRDHRGQVPRRQLLAGRRAGDDVGRRDRS